MATKKSAAATDAMKPVEAAVAAGKETVEKASKAAFKSYDEFTVLNKDNVDAVMKSGAIVAKGYEAIGQEVMAFAKASIEANVATAQALFGAKTLREAVDLQTEFTRKAFDNMMAESAKLGEMSVKLANDAAQPLQARVNVTVETMMKPVAA